MDVVFSESGYPNRIDLSYEFRDLDFSIINWHELKKIYDKIKPVVEYWEENRINHENKQYGEIKKGEYNEIVRKLQKKYFGSDLEDAKTYHQI